MWTFSLGILIPLRQFVVSSNLLCSLEQRHSSLGIDTNVLAWYFFLSVYLPFIQEVSLYLDFSRTRTRHLEIVANVAK